MTEPRLCSGSAIPMGFNMPTQSAGETTSLIPFPVQIFPKKTVFLSMRTETGLLLERLFHDLPRRYMLCWAGQGEEEVYDCACCMVGVDDPNVKDCPCVCHFRIEKMARDPEIALWLTAMKAMDRMPEEAEKICNLPPEPAGPRNTKLPGAKDAWNKMWAVLIVFAAAIMFAAAVMYK